MRSSSSFFLRASSSARFFASSAFRFSSSASRFLRSSSAFAFLSARSFCFAMCIRASPCIITAFSAMKFIRACSSLSRTPTPRKTFVWPMR